MLFVPPLPGELQVNIRLRCTKCDITMKLRYSHDRSSLSEWFSLLFPFVAFQILVTIIVCAILVVNV